jgi:hypothetical protein
MLKDLVKQEQLSSSNTVSVAKIPESSSENSSDTESSSESEYDENIRKVEKTLSALELNRVKNPRFSPTSLTKNCVTPRFLQKGVSENFDFSRDITPSSEL